MALERSHQRDASKMPLERSNQRDVSSSSSSSQSSTESCMTSSTIPTSLASQAHTATRTHKADHTPTSSSPQTPTHTLDRDRRPSALKRPQAPDRFDSLQELLEQAGYKDTRVITPHSNALFGTKSSSASASSSRTASVAKDNDLTPTKSRSAFATLPTQEPAAALPPPPPSTTSAPKGATSWFGSLWWGAPRSPSPAPAPTTSVEEHSVAQSGTPGRPATLRSVSASSPTKAKVAAPKLRNARSAAHLPLWKGSRTTTGKHLLTKASLGQLGTAATAAPQSHPASSSSLGVGISAADHGAAFGRLKKTVSIRTSQEGLAKAFANGSKPTVTSDNSTPTNRSSVEEWRSSLVSLKENTDDVVSPPRPTRSTKITDNENMADLFGSLATPIITSAPAVAPRNAECFQGPEARGLRHAKSVEALKGALKGTKKQNTLKQRHSTIGQGAAASSSSRQPEEIPPVPALPSIPSDPSITSSVGLGGRTIYRDDQGLPMASSPPERQLPSSPTESERRQQQQGPPVLTLTSPSGVHSPQFIRLDSREFSISFSPEQQRRILARMAKSVGSGSTEQQSVPVGEDSDIMITQQPLPAQLRNIDSSTRADEDEQRRRSCLANGPRRMLEDASSDEENFDDGGSDDGRSTASSAASSNGGVPRRRKTRRGRRGGRKHRPRSEVETRQDAAPVDKVAPAARRRSRSSSKRPSTTEGRIPTTVVRMPSFGLALDNLPNQAGVEDEDDPFIAHVTREERRRSMSSSALYSRNSSSTKKSTVSSDTNIEGHGIASILAARVDAMADNDENAQPATLTKDVSPTLRTRRSNSSLKGRIIARPRPISETVSERISRMEGPQSMMTQMMISTSSHHIPDSPTKSVVARRLKSSRSRNRVAL
ncbi:unnamed protein product [Sympodiomycopsis kandeliae]